MKVCIFKATVTANILYSVWEEEQLVGYSNNTGYIEYNVSGVKLNSPEKVKIKAVQ